MLSWGSCALISVRAKHTQAVWGTSFGSSERSEGCLGHLTQCLALWDTQSPSTAPGDHWQAVGAVIYEMKNVLSMVFIDATSDLPFIAYIEQLK